jgi:hypothetical protein
MITAPSALPDEIDKGIEGRIRRLNGFSSTKELQAAMQKAACHESPENIGLTRVELLARTIQIDICEFVRAHTTLPLRRAFTSYKPHLHHGSPESKSMFHSSTMRLARPGAYLCRSCVAEDMSFRGIAYWRRYHQMPGLYWCNRHLEPLAFIKNEFVFDQSTQSMLNFATPVDDKWVNSLIATTSIQRYIEICSAFLERDKPIEVMHVASVLTYRAKQFGLSTYINGNKPLLSDLVKESFPAEWLSTIFPKLVVKPHRQSMSSMDGVLYLNTSACSVTAYALALAVLYDSADEALYEITSESISSKPKRNRRLLASENWSDSAFFESYVKHHGSIISVAQDMSASPAAIRRQIAKHCLPDFGLLSREGLRTAAKLFFLDGVSYDEACQRSGVNKSEFDVIIRMSGNSALREALKKMNESNKKRNLNPKRPRPYTPFNINYIN